jgi:hypothetical protein
MPSGGIARLTAMLGTQQIFVCNLAIAAFHLACVHNISSQ